MQVSDQQVYCTGLAYNYPIVRIKRIDNPPESCEHEVVNEMQFSDDLTGRLSLSIRTGCTMAFSDRVSWRERGTFMFAYYIAQHVSRLLMNSIFGSTSLLYGSCLKFSNRTD